MFGTVIYFPNYVLTYLLKHLMVKYRRCDDHNSEFSHRRMADLNGLFCQCKDPHRVSPSPSRRLWRCELSKQIK